eukprot:TRINITY_DN36848_c0_g1_i1.p1 TRINITY_DN36848_c0_g1~~TRINITY_DN36848_c0_g1_i1.p1  ORF type:complete len:197 (-),score=13.90 TRINITY_DN36848_c0_g1_i1:75-665(-)
MPGTWCPSVDNVVIHPISETDQILDGLYTVRALEIGGCEEGFFCQKGQRNQCPVGYYCDEFASALPKQCSTSPYFNTTCFHQALANQPGLSAPIACDLGSICLVPYLPGIPAPPGYAINPEAKDDFVNCTLGDWCVMGLSSLVEKEVDNATILVPADLRCPESCYCNSSDILQPTVCNFSSEFAYYCPAGSFEQRP